MSKDGQEYNVLKGLIDGSQKHTLDHTKILSETQAKGLLALFSSDSVYVLHDGCDIRKPSAPGMEHIGRVRDLPNKNTINGYKTFNSVGIDISKKEINLLFHEVYSTNLPNYVSKEDISNILKMSPEVQKMVSDKAHINTGVMYKKAIETTGALLKQNNAKAKICHVSDREFDSEEYFEHITSFYDDFITRIKLSRNSHHTKPKLTKTGKVSKTPAPQKLVDKTFANNGKREIAKITLKGKVYNDIVCKIGWEALVLNEKEYSVARISLMQHGKPLFGHPMLLLTNQKTATFEQALEIYKGYLLRFKIEIVFKFLKQNLGWENFQVRDFESIKNLLAVAFYLVGYFKELETHLKEHKMSLFLCELAKSKGKITLFYLLEGLAKLVGFQEVLVWKTENNISDEDIAQMIQLLQPKTTP